MRIKLYSKTAVLASLAALLLSACATDKLPDSKRTGELSVNEYERLRKVDLNEPGVNAYRWVSPDFKRIDYTGVIIDPIKLNQNATKNSGNKGLTEETIYQTRHKIDKDLRTKAEKRFNVVNQPGTGIGRLSITITGMEVEGQSFMPWNAIPIGAVLYAGQKVAGVDSKTAVLAIEAKMRDSLTGKLMGEIVYTVSSDTFRLESSTPEAFAKMAVIWITSAVRTASIIPPKQ